MLERKKTPLHFVGIGGIGMSGIAEVFLREGHSISGSDLTESDLTRRLANLGAHIHIGHHPENIGTAKVVVISSAVKNDNPEVLEARKRHLPVIPRAEMLAELMRSRTSIAVAGTHGKTTTTSLVATVLSHAHLDPTIIIGGKVDALGGNAKLGRSSWLVAEADESDGSFLKLPATYSIITNIDNDHLDHFGSLKKIQDAFITFQSQLPFNGVSALCAEDPVLRECFSQFSKPFITYGFSSQCDVYADGLETTPLGTRFQVHYKDRSGASRSGTIELQIPGKHNVLNALGTVALTSYLGLDFQLIAEGLQRFQGVKRRFEIKYNHEARSIQIVDDYGHHPTEISATLDAARNHWKGKRIRTIFQPHRYTRTQLCLEGFTKAFPNTDELWITDIYPAGETPIDGVTTDKLIRSIREKMLDRIPIHHGGAVQTLAYRILPTIQPGDLILCLGAGSITRLADELAEALKNGSHS